MVSPWFSKFPIALGSKMVKPIISGPYRTFRPLNAEESFIEFEGSTVTIPMKARASASDP